MSSVCAKHPELNGARNKNRVCKGCQAEATKAWNQKSRDKGKQYDALLAAAKEVVRYFPKRGGAPGHEHKVPGKWDGDTKHPAGSTCMVCKVFNELRALV